MLDTLGVGLLGTRTAVFNKALQYSQVRLNVCLKSRFIFLGPLIHLVFVQIILSGGVFCCSAVCRCLCLRRGAAFGVNRRSLCLLITLLLSTAWR